MQLRNARLCLNCEEIHAATHCPVCTSDSFAYVSRWIPADERRGEARRPSTSAASLPAAAATSARPTAPPHMRWVKRGAAGVAVLAASRLLWQWSRPVEWADDADIPEDVEQRSAESDETID